LIFAALVPTGCVRRRMAVRTNPPGALVFIDNQQIGTTPCSVDFTYYGTREIRLVKPGYETLTVNQPIPSPWYQIPPLDFVSENLVPTKILDHRTVSYELQPQLIVPPEQLIDRANQLRQETLQQSVVPAAAVGVPNVVVPSTSAPQLPDTYGPPATVAPTPMLLPPTTPGMPAPFTAPSLPALPPATPGYPQQGPPLVSPPLR
jgi:hypothetical protein